MLAVRRAYSNTSRKNNVRYGDSIAFYDVTCKSYDELYKEEQYGKYEYAIVKKGFYPHSTVLDLGCGTGLLYSFLEEKGLFTGKYICLDPSMGMLNMFLMKKPINRYNVLVIQGFGELLPLKSNSVGTIYSFTVINNVVRREDFLREVGRVLIDKGFALISVLKKDPNRRCIEEAIMRICDDGLVCNFIGCKGKDCFYVLVKI